MSPNVQRKCPLSGKMCECSLVKAQGADILAGDLNSLTENIQRVKNEKFNNVTGRAAGFFKKIYLGMVELNLKSKHKKVSNKANKYCGK